MRCRESLPRSSRSGGGGGFSRDDSAIEVRPDDPPRRVELGAQPVDDRGRLQPGEGLGRDGTLAGSLRSMIARRSIS